ncbi:MAG: DUF429 domain-containing protein [Verrucomicrobiota bacterium]
MLIAGIDLAWGYRNPDGICLIEQASSGEWEVRDWFLSLGTEALIYRCQQWKQEAKEKGKRKGKIWLMVDAPLLCLNQKGRRPVDGECQKVFRIYEAGPHPVNTSMPSVQRALRFSRLMRKEGWIVDWDPKGQHQMMEVFPHPALVRFLGLKKSIKYKRGSREEKNLAFADLQKKLKRFTAKHLPVIHEQATAMGFWSSSWNKGLEDQLDALICAMVGWHHYEYGGERSQILGNQTEGFILVPD